MPEALAEWAALDGSVRAPLKKLLAKRLDNPHVRRWRAAWCAGGLLIYLKNGDAQTGSLALVRSGSHSELF